MIYIIRKKLENQPCLRRLQISENYRNAHDYAYNMYNICITLIRYNHPHRNAYLQSEYRYCFESFRISVLLYTTSRLHGNEL